MNSKMIGSAQMEYEQSMIGFGNGGNLLKIIWPEAQINNNVHYFTDEADLVSHILNGDDAALKLYFEQFTTKENGISAYNNLSAADRAQIDMWLKTIGYTGVAAGIIFALALGGLPAIAAAPEIVAALEILGLTGGSLAISLA